MSRSRTSISRVAETPRNTSPTTGLPLNPEMVKKGRELEMQYMELKVLEDSDRDACMAEMGRPPIPTDWVDWSVKRHVGRSTLDVEDWAATFAATPSVRSYQIATKLDDDSPKVTGRRRR